ncbi:MAG TPA: biopolymer transporter ExbD [Methylibium sp.]|uniref:ExbD/TolR family protein n=1 Tax=Methylibium sp. TaxID=2067992 RepID=UPI002DC0647B|nr:biopolymer transporter ExbD [Methylibium sp.]HEU4459725.1 biopolymer transporter ExbD [Methylibium sp.]
MGMNVGSSSGDSEPEVMMDINTTPLIDVMLVLLIMLIITIPIQLHAINLDLPTGTPPPQTVQPQIVKIDIDEKNQIFFNAEPVATMQDVDYRLSEIAKLDFASQPELHLRPNKDARYDVVAGVMASVQRYGLTKFGIVGAEQFIE